VESDGGPHPSRGTRVPRRTPGAHNAVTGAHPDDLQPLYVDNGLSLSEIAARYSCSLTTIWRKLKAAGIEMRPDGSAPRYPRRDFSGDQAEKAYLVGFRIGDLNVELDGNSIVVKCTSTRPEQVELFRLLFERYRHVYTDEATLARRQRQSIGMSVALNFTFEFLVFKEDYVPEWMLNGSDACFFAFLVGYIDAEGYLCTYLPRGYKTPQARLEVRTYDGNLLSELAEELNARGIACPTAQVRVQAGYVNGRGVRSNGVQWGLAVCTKNSLRILFERVDPYLRHRKRRLDMTRAWQTAVLPES
jgi:hypothetical protein